MELPNKSFQHSCSYICFHAVAFNNFLADISSEAFLALCHLLTWTGAASLVASC
jgi:hypothetical protein